MTPDDLRVTLLEQDDAGVWRAHVTFGGQTRDVDRKHGSWRYTPADDAVRWRECETWLAAELQARVRPRERAARRDAEAVVA